MIHQDAEIVTQKGTSNAERPSRGDDKKLPQRKEHDGNISSIGLRKERNGRLVQECPVVERVAE